MGFLGDFVEGFVEGYNNAVNADPNENPEGAAVIERNETAVNTPQVLTPEPVVESLPAAQPQPSDPLVIDSFEGMSNWLSGLQQGASPAVKQAISAQLRVIRFVQSPTLVDTTFDTLMYSMEKSVSVARSQEEVAGLREVFVLMIQNYVFFMDAKLQMSVNKNKDEARKLFIEAGELLSNSVKDVAVMAVSGESRVNIARTTVSNLFAPENEGKGLIVMFKKFLNVFVEENIIYEKTKEFYDTIGVIITKLGEHRNLIGGSRLLAGTIKRYLPGMENFYLADIPDTIVLKEEIRTIRLSNKIACGIFIGLSLALALIRGIFHWIANSGSEGWFLYQMLITAIIVGLSSTIAFLRVRSKQKKEEALTEGVKRKIGQYAQIGDWYSASDKADSIPVVSRPPVVETTVEPKSKVDALIELKSLLAAGALTQEEFNEQVKMIRGDVAAPAPEKQGNKEEQDYVEMFKEYSADGEISERDRKMLEKLRQRLGISESRAKELEEDCLNPHLTEDEQEYLAMYEEYAADGEISERDKKMLAKMRERMGISESRAEELINLTVKK